MSTAACKALLAKNFPHTVLKDWKRETKYLNFEQVEIRRFAHQTVGQVYVDEDREEISLNDHSLQFRSLSMLTAQDFYFNVTMCEEDQAPCAAFVSLVHRFHFDTEGFMDSVHLWDAVRRFLPKGIDCSEEMESVFAIDNDLSKEDLIEKFVAAGFVPSESLDNLILGVSAPAREEVQNSGVSQSIMALLKQTYPKTDHRFSRLVQKHKNHQGLEVNVLFHPDLFMVWVIEDDQEVTRDGWRHSLKDISRLKPEDYLVHAFPVGSGVQAFFTLGHYFEQEYQVEDMELDFLEMHIPKALGRLEFNEGGGVLFTDQSDPKVVLDKLNANGFRQNKPYRDHIQSEYDSE
jgi:hypothetical protein